MSRVDAAISTLGVAKESNISCFNSKSEFFSGFKIIKLYFSITIPSLWVFLVSVDGGAVRTRTNHNGGVNGGITNGNPLVFRVAFKPTSSIRKAGVPGRHDVCFALRTPVVVEAVTAIVLADLLRIM